MARCSRIRRSAGMGDTAGMEGTAGTARTQPPRAAVGTEGAADRAAARWVRGPRAGCSCRNSCSHREVERQNRGINQAVGCGGARDGSDRLELADHDAELAWVGCGGERDRA